MVAEINAPSQIRGPVSQAVACASEAVKQVRETALQGATQPRPRRADFAIAVVAAFEALFRAHPLDPGEFAEDTAPQQEG